MIDSGTILKIESSIGVADGSDVRHEEHEE